MKKVLLLIAFIATTTFTFAQANKGLNFGLGLSNGGFPVYVNYDIPVGANVSIAPAVQANLNGFDWITPSVKVDYYFDELMGLPATFDLYGGANLGFTIYLNSDNGTSGLYAGLEVGGRWWFQENMGLSLEFAGGTGFGTKLGLSMKM